MATAFAHADSQVELHPDEELSESSKWIHPEKAGSRPFAYGAEDRPSWLPRIVARLKSTARRDVELKQYMLFRHNGAPTFLALTWDTHGYEYPELFELYRVRVISERNVRLNFVPVIKDLRYSDHMDIVEPSGRDIFGDGVARLFVEYACGGLDYTCHGMRILRLGHVPVDETPDWAGRVGRIIDLDGDGRAEVIASDDRWAHEFLDCSACGPDVAVVLKAEISSYRHACRTFASNYAWTVRYAEQNGSQHEKDVPYLLQHASQAALEAAQSGDFATSTRILDETRAAARKLMDSGSARDRRIGQTLMRYFENDVANVIQRAAAEHGAAECPLADVRFKRRDYMDLVKLYERRDD
jgi:hypothetical protein